MVAALLVLARLGEAHRELPAALRVGVDAAPAVELPPEAGRQLLVRDVAGVAPEPRRAELERELVLRPPMGDDDVARRQRLAETARQAALPGAGGAAGARLRRLRPRKHPRHEDAGGADRVPPTRVAVHRRRVGTAGGSAIP
jgi:hypothetical protein